MRQAPSRRRRADSSALSISPDPRAADSSGVLCLARGAPQALGCGILSLATLHRIAICTSIPFKLVKNIAQSDGHIQPKQNPLLEAQLRQLGWQRHQLISFLRRIAFATMYQAASPARTPKRWQFLLLAPGFLDLSWQLKS